MMIRRHLPTQALTTIALRSIALLSIVIGHSHSEEKEIDTSFFPEPIESTDNIAPVIQQAFSDPNLAEFTEYFPADTTAATWVFYWPAVFQGGSGLHLELPCDDAEQLWLAHKDKFIYSHAGPITGWVQNTKTIEKPSGAEPLPINHRNEEDGSFDETWKIGMFAAQPTKTTGPHIWNHGHMVGLAVNTKMNTVVYFAEKW